MPSHTPSRPDTHPSRSICGPARTLIDRSLLWAPQIVVLMELLPEYHAPASSEWFYMEQAYKTCWCTSCKGAAGFFSPLSVLFMGTHGRSILLDLKALLVSGPIVHACHSWCTWLGFVWIADFLVLSPQALLPLDTGKDRVSMGSSKGLGVQALKAACVFTSVLASVNLLGCHFPLMPFFFTLFVFIFSSYFVWIFKATLNNWWK